MKHLILTLVTILIISSSVEAKKPGKFAKYSQITDKEVLIESNKGTKVLFTAYNNNSIGVTFYNKEEKPFLITPVQVGTHTELLGSIYVEELDELMQITTTSDDGISIKIDTDKFGFTFIDKKSNSTIVLEEEFTAGMIDKDAQVCFIVDNGNSNRLMAEVIH